MFNETDRKNFLNEVIGDMILNDAVDWIMDNLDPEDVFN